MDRLNLLIADSAHEFSLELSAALQDTYTVFCCSNGREAMNYIRSQQPDIIVLDLLLPELDGISLLCNAAQHGIRPVVLATTRLITDYVIETAQSLNVGYLMVKPCDPIAAADRVRDLSKRVCPVRSRRNDPAELISDCLSELNVPTRLHGYSYLREAILIWSKEPGIALTKELYPTIGSKYGSTGVQVERSIRNAINLAWDHRDNEVWSRYLPFDPDGTVPHPSNGVFIASVAAALRLEALSSSAEG